MILFKFTQQFAIRRMAGGRKIQGFRVLTADFAVYTSSQTDCGFRHTDNQQRLRQILRKLLTEAAVNTAHDFRLDRDMAAQHFADKQKRPFRVTPLRYSEQGVQGFRAGVAADFQRAGCQGEPVVTGTGKTGHSDLSVLHCSGKTGS
ncbi:Uncharacterised protein [Klebsiella pneumoniae]|nr:Uncharacterised protein [Klebsiella pneumoniae]